MILFACLKLLSKIEPRKNCFSCQILQRALYLNILYIYIYFFKSHAILCLSISHECAKVCSFCLLFLAVRISRGKFCQILRNYSPSTGWKFCLTPWLILVVQVKVSIWKKKQIVNLWNFKSDFKFNFIKLNIDK